MSRRSICKKLITFIFLALFLCNGWMVYATEEGDTIVYFYSSTCSSCQRLEGFFSTIQSDYKNVSIIKYNIVDLNHKSLLDEYNERYHVSEEHEGIVPVVFIHDKYFTGEKTIEQYTNDITHGCCAQCKSI